MTRVLSRWFGWRSTREGRFKHLTMVLSTGPSTASAGGRLRFLRAPQPLVSSTIGRAPWLRTRRRVGRGSRAPDARFSREGRFFACAWTSHWYRLACSPWRAHERGPSILYDTMYLYALSEPTCDFLWVASYDASSAAIAPKSISRDARGGARAAFLLATKFPAAPPCAFTKSMKIVQPEGPRVRRSSSAAHTGHHLDVCNAAAEGGARGVKEEHVQ